MDRPPRVLVLGAYGVFGSRACSLLLRRGIEVVAAGRSAERAAALAATFPGAAIAPAALDAGAPDLADRLRALDIRVLVHAAGPFQGQDYRVARACIGAGVHYIDLADGAEFVAGIDALDEAARAAGVTVVSGASTVPALTSAILAAMEQRHGRPLRQVTAWLSPGNRTPRGLAVVRAILGYTGRPVAGFGDGAPLSRIGWGGLHRFSIGAPPGLGGTSPSPLGRRWFSDVETPDAVLLPRRFPGLVDARFYAGLELPILHLGLWALSWPVRWRLARSLAPLARPLWWIADRLIGLGSDRGGMSVRAVLGDPPDLVRAEWLVIADDGSGPTIPAVPAVVIAERLLQGLEPPGARPCLAMLPLADFAAAVAHLPIAIHESASVEPSLFQRLLGPAWGSLPAAVQAMHRTGRRMTARGRYRAERPAGLLPRLAARVTGFPPSAADGELAVTFEALPDGSERWTRDFAGHIMRSRLAPLPGHNVFREQFKQVSGVLRLVPEPRALRFEPLRLRVGPLPLPRWLTPRVEAREWEDGGRFRFEVSIAMPLIGPCVRYEGWLAPPQDDP